MAVTFRRLNCVLHKINSVLAHRTGQIRSIADVSRILNGAAHYSRDLSTNSMAANAVKSMKKQNFDYFLVLDFEATCDNKGDVIPQVL